SAFWICLPTVVTNCLHLIKKIHQCSPYYLRELARQSIILPQKLRQIKYDLMIHKRLEFIALIQDSLYFHLLSFWLGSDKFENSSLPKPGKPPPLAVRHEKVLPYRRAE
ncbi:hypothetical protein, partial [Thiolapillus sp.]|uniref:hypothetical protein n=1 Tax=Thiolapillus sp. TaxID=2017437 RepID=UPI003AF765CD